MLLHALACFGQMEHALAQFASDAAALFFAHLIEPVESLADLGHDCGFDLAVGTFVGGVERAGDTQNRVKVRRGRQRKLGRGGSEGSDVSAHNFAVQRECLGGRAFQAQRDFNVAARHLLFQQAAKLHLEGIGAGRKPEMKIEKAMIDGLQRQRKPHAAVGLSRCGGRQPQSPSRWISPLTWAKPVIERMGIGDVAFKFLLLLVGASALANCSS